MTVITKILMLSTMLLSATALPAMPCSTNNAAGMHWKDCLPTPTHIEPTHADSPTMAELDETDLPNELLSPPTITVPDPAIPQLIDSALLNSTLPDSTAEKAHTQADEALAVLEQRTSDGEFFNCGKQTCVTPSMCCGAEVGCFPPSTGCPTGTRVTGPPSMLDFVPAPKPTMAQMTCDGAGYCVPNEE